MTVMENATRVVTVKKLPQTKKKKKNTYKAIVAVLDRH